jgi:outer membrane protein
VRRFALIVVVATATAMLSEPASAQERRWLGRVRVFGMLPDYSSGVVAGTGTKLKVDSTAGGEAGVTYFLNPQWAFELSAAAMPITLSTVGGQFPGLGVGRLDLVCGLLSLEYHFATLGRIKPYFGFGAALVRPTGFSLGADMPANGVANLTFTSSLRVLTQFGGDLEIGKGWRLNVDFRYVPATTNVEFFRTTGGTLDTVGLVIDPILVSFGVGRSF